MLSKWVTLPVRGSTPGNRLPSDVIGLIKTHIFSVLCIASNSQRLLCSFCYSSLRFPPANSYCSYVWRDAFRHSAVRLINQATLPTHDIWQHVIKNDTHKASTARLHRRCPAAGNVQRSALWKTLKWADSSKGGCNL